MLERLLAIQGGLAKQLVVNASLNWASIVGLILFFYGVLTAPLGIAQIFFILQRRADTSPAVIAKTVVVLMQALGDFSSCLFVGVSCFQGWRLIDFAIWTISLVVVPA